jgi:chondroitin sulfate proteoglycan 4
MRSFLSFNHQESLYIGTDKRVIRLPMHRCEKFDAREECLGSRDPFCGWDSDKNTCTTRPKATHGDVGYWEQELTECPSEKALGN